MRLAGLSIEGNKIRASIVNRLPGRSTPIRSLEFNMPGVDGQRQQEFSAVLSRLAEDDGVRGVSIGLGASAFSHHYLDLPLTKKQDIKHALSFELEKYLPLPPEDYIFDFVTVSHSSQNSAGTRVLVLSMLKNKLDWIVSAVESQGMMLVAIRCGAMEALNEFTASHEANDMIFAYKGHDATSIFGMNNNAPESLRVIRSGMPTEKDITEMSRSYTRNAFSAGEYGSDKLPALEAMELNYSLPDILAHSAFKKRKFDMFFAPGQGSRAVPLWQEYAPLVLGVLCVLMLLLTTAVSYYKDKSTLKTLNDELSQVKSQAAELLDVQKEVVDITKRTAYLNKFRKDRNQNIEALAVLSNLLPVSAWLTGFTMTDEGTLTIRGYAVRASELFKPIEGSQMFKHVAFSSPVTISGGREKFSIKMEIER